MNYVMKRNLVSKMTEACTSGDLGTITILVENSTMDFYYDLTLCVKTACENGHMHVLKWFVSKYYVLDYVYIMFHLCQKNYPDLVKFILDHCNKYPSCGDMAKIVKMSIYGACKGGNLSILTLLIKNGLYVKFFNPSNDGYLVLKYASQGGNLDIVVLLLTFMEGYKVSNDITRVDGGIYHNRTVFNMCLEGACIGGHINVVKFAIKNGAINYGTGMIRACQYNHIELVKMMMTYGANHWDNFLKFACAGTSGGSEIIDLMIQCGASNWDESLLVACKFGNIGHVKMMIQHGANLFNINDCFIEACVHNHTKIAKLLVDLGANDYNRGLTESIKNNNMELINLMVQKGATNLEKLKDIDEFKLACVYCKHIGGDPANDTMCKTLLKTYPVFVLLCSKNHCSSVNIISQWFPNCLCLGADRHTKKPRTNNNHMKRLPQEILRLLHRYI